ncbi:hypothetical protein [Niveibacterium sp. SC-1]|uniref:hypothetical protein n=1 Tax=Niveibacterium sp. SC-1 TaxID=3135646 RepID=UPI00311FB864
MAQLGEHVRARELLRRAARGFGAHEALARARCVVAEAEVALAMRELDGSPRALDAAAVTLEQQGDRANALWARLVAVRRQLLLGRLHEAATSLREIDAAGMAPVLGAVTALARAEVALRSLDTATARLALASAGDAAEHAGVAALIAEVRDAHALLDRTAARRLHGGHEEPLRLEEVEALLASGVLVVDACRHGLKADGVWVPLARRPVLFGLLRALAEAWPGEVARQRLIAQVFRIRTPDESHRARLRVEIGRLRALIALVAEAEATSDGFRLKVPEGRRLVVLAPPIDGAEAALLALLSDGAAWSTSALAVALGDSQRTVQRALAELQEEGRVRSIGRGRSQRWLAPPLAGFTTILLLAAALPPG